jgi:hypothetical protein
MEPEGHGFHHGVLTDICDPSRRRVGRASPGLRAGADQGLGPLKERGRARIDFDLRPRHLQGLGEVELAPDRLTRSSGVAMAGGPRLGTRKRRAGTACGRATPRWGPADAVLEPVPAVVVGGGNVGDRVASDLCGRPRCLTARLPAAGTTSWTPQPTPSMMAWLLR